MQQAGRKIELLFPRGIKLGNSQLLVCEILQLQRTVWTKWYLRSGQSSKLHLPSLEDLSDKPLVLQNKKCWKVGTSGCSSKDLSTSTHASVLLGKYCYMERFCFKHIHFLYNEEHFSLWKINELTFFFFSLVKVPGETQGKVTNTLQRSTVTLKLLVWVSWKCCGLQLAGERKLCSSSRWPRRQSEQQLMSGGVRTIAEVKSIWSATRVGTRPTSSRWIISRKMNLSSCWQSMTSCSGRKFGGKFWGENRWVDWISETKGDVLGESLFYLRASFSSASFGLTYLDPSTAQNAVWMGRAMACQERAVFPAFSGVRCL